MKGWARYRRSLIVAVLSVGVAAWCLAGAARSDNDRWLRNLHSGHQSDTFRQALANVNQTLPAGKRMDECSACHTRRDWVANLVQPLASLQNESCGRCHQAHPEGAASAGAGATSPLGVPWMGQRLSRPAHAGMDYPRNESGMPIPLDGRVECAECHPDHGGKGSVEQVKTDEGMRVRITQVCVGCHLPRQQTTLAATVLKEFARAHKADNSFDPRLPNDLRQAVEDAPAGAPLEGGLQNAFVDSVLAKLREQVFFDEPDETRRGCTPGCHGEHTPNSSGDASHEKYDPTAKPTESATADGPGSRWERLAAGFGPRAR